MYVYGKRSTCSGKEMGYNFYNKKFVTHAIAITYIVIIGGEQFDHRHGMTTWWLTRFRKTFAQSERRLEHVATFYERRVHRFVLLRWLVTHASLFTYSVAVHETCHRFVQRASFLVYLAIVAT